MAANTRFATGVHVLVLLAAHPDSLQTSADLAAELNTNPVVIRRILSSLQQADLIQSQKGPSGGSRLLRSPKEITLADVFEAVETNTRLHVPSANSGSAVAVNALLEKAYAESTRCLIEQLDKTTLSQMIKRVGKAGRR
jgi:Rrf2 family protein